MIIEDIPVVIKQSNVDFSRRAKIAGTIEVPDSDPTKVFKRVCLFDRGNFKLYADSNTKIDKTFELWCEDLLGNKYFVAAFDDSDQYNARVFDRISIGLHEFKFSDSEMNDIKNAINNLIYSVKSRCDFELFNSFSNFPIDNKKYDLKNQIKYVEVVGSVEPTYTKSMVFDLIRTHKQFNSFGCNGGIRRIEFLDANGNVIPMTTNFSWYATRNHYAGTPQKLFGTTYSKHNDYQDGLYYGDAHTGNRVICVFNTPTPIYGMVINNFHHYGNGLIDGAYYNNYSGVVELKAQSTPDTYTDTTYNATVTNGSTVLDCVVKEHAPLNIIDDEYFSILPSTNFQASFKNSGGSSIDISTYDIRVGTTIEFESGEILTVKSIDNASTGLFSFSESTYPGKKIVKSINNYYKKNEISEPPLTKSIVLDFIGSNANASYFGLRKLEFLGPKGNSIFFHNGTFTTYETRVYWSFKRVLIRDLIPGESGTEKIDGTERGGLLTNPSIGVRVTFNLNDPIRIYGIKICNGHNYGDFSISVKDLKITVTPDSITSTIYNEAVSNGEVLFNGSLISAFNGNSYQTTSDYLIYDRNEIAKNKVIEYKSSKSEPYNLNSVLEFNFDKTLMIGEAAPIFTVDEIKPTNTNIFYAISFDEKLTYKIWTGAVWKAVISKDDSVHGNTGNTSWHYIDNLNAWNLATKNSIEYAIIDAAAHASNQMDGVIFEAITSPQFGETGGFSNLIGECNIAVLLTTTDNTTCPTLRNISAYPLDKKISIGEVYDLSSYSETIASSKVYWSYIKKNLSFNDSKIKVYSLITGQANWNLCTNGGSIPGITENMITTGKTLQFKMVMDNDVDGLTDVDARSINLFFEIK